MLYQHEKLDQDRVLQEKDHFHIASDEADVLSVYADVAQVQSSREEFMLLFGSTQTELSNQEELRVKLVDRVVLGPFTAKKLLGQLINVVREYESIHGTLTEARPSQSGPMPGLFLPPFKSPVTKEKVDLLFRLLNDLHLRMAFERSFKVSEESLDGNRFLVGVNKYTISRTRYKSIVDICAKLGMPKNFLENFRKNLQDANVFGFGMDEKSDTCIVKSYLEFGSRYEEAMKKAPQDREPYISHLGFKWDSKDNTQCALTKYTCFPGLGVREMLDKLSGRYCETGTPNPYPIIERVMEVASSRGGRDKFVYLEVSEENNPRSSFDLNFYSANLRMKEVNPILMEICRHYLIPDEAFQALYAQAKEMYFGHLAGGTDRKGKDFLTVYFGV